MRLFILLIGLLPPQLVRAQLFNSFGNGSYILNDDRTTRRQGQLKLQGSDRLVVKPGDGKTLKFGPEQVAAFWIGPKKYVTVSSINVKAGIISGADLDNAFVEQLDSGRVVLMRLNYSTGNGYSGGYSGSAYVLRSGYYGSPVVVQGGTYSSGGMNFRELMRPFLATRPELVKYLDEKRINIDNLGSAIYALNHNLPFTPPSALNLD